MNYYAPGVLASACVPAVTAHLPLLSGARAISRRGGAAAGRAGARHLDVGGYLSRHITHFLWHRFPQKLGLSGRPLFLLLDPLTSRPGPGKFCCSFLGPENTGSLLCGPQFWF